MRLKHICLTSKLQGGKEFACIALLAAGVSMGCAREPKLELTKETVANQKALADCRSEARSALLEEIHGEVAVNVDSVRRGLGAEPLEEVALVFSARVSEEGIIRINEVNADCGERKCEGQKLEEMLDLSNARIDPKDVGCDIEVSTTIYPYGA